MRNLGAHAPGVRDGFPGGSGEGAADPGCPSPGHLCKQAPKPELAKIDYAKADAVVVDAEIAKMASEAMTPPTDDQGNVDHKRWAKTLQKRHEAGEKLSVVQIDMYQTALGIKPNPINV
jgi:hypothetical protein